MTQEEKQLLLKDLSARLPYGVIMTNKMLTETYYPLDGNEWQKAYFDNDWDDVPYLRQMSSMTEEERNELAEICGVDYIDDKIVDFGEFLCEGSPINIKNIYGLLERLNAHHYDYRSLIPLGLAIEVTEENNPYKN